MLKVSNPVDDQAGPGDGWSEGSLETLKRAARQELKEKVTPEENLKEHRHEAWGSRRRTF